MIPWSPLARGFLTGRYKRNEAPDSPRLRSDRWLKERFFRPEDFDVVERVEELAKEKGVSMAQVALAWLLAKGVTAPIIGATKVQHVEEAVAALDVHLTVEETRRLEELYKPHPVLGHT